MSRAALLIALHETLGRLPTTEERHAFLQSLARQCGGERVYIAHRQMTADEAADEIERLRAAGWSVRRIAGAVGWSKSAVSRVLCVPNSALKMDTQSG
jgi:hypothetical protein